MEVLFEGQPLVRFDTRQAATDQATSSKLIQLERSELDNKLKSFKVANQFYRKKLKLAFRLQMNWANLLNAADSKEYNIFNNLISYMSFKVNFQM